MTRSLPTRSRMAPAYGSCWCGKRVQLDRKGHLRPHQVPIQQRKDPKQSERCPMTARGRRAGRRRRGPTETPDMTPRDPTIGLLESPQRKPAPKANQKAPAKPAPPPAPKPALVKAGAEHERGRPKATTGAGQNRLDGTTTTAEESRLAYERKAFEFAVADQKWKDAQAARDVRLDDLVKANAKARATRPFDSDGLVRVAKETAAAIQAEKDNLVVKHEAKKTLNEAWDTYAAFNERPTVRPLVPGDE